MDGKVNHHQKTVGLYLSIYLGMTIQYHNIRVIRFSIQMWRLPAGCQRQIWMMNQGCGCVNPRVLPKFDMFPIFSGCNLSQDFWTNHFWGMVTPAKDVFFPFFFEAWWRWDLDNSDWYLALTSIQQLTWSGCWFGTWILFFHHMLGISSSQLTNSYFSEG